MIFVMRQVTALFTHEFFVHHTIGHIVSKVICTVAALNLLHHVRGLPIERLLLVGFLVLIVKAGRLLDLLIV